MQVQCALRDWQTGVRIKSSSDFSADEWTAHYKAHVRELERMRDAKPREVDMWTRKLWKDCWYVLRKRRNVSEPPAGVQPASSLRTTAPKTSLSSHQMSWTTSLTSRLTCSVCLHLWHLRCVYALNPAHTLSPTLFPRSVPPAIR